MSQLRNAKAGDLEAFPGATFVVNDTPPETQCQETEITEINCQVSAGFPTITKIGAFIGIDLAGKKVDTGNINPPNNGTWNVLSNTDDVLTTDHVFTAGGAVATIDVYDLGQAYLTRNESSFQRFTENAGKAHTTKGGQLFVDVAAGPLAGACSDTFNPQ